MTPRTKHWLKFSIRWGIAVVGITWVLVSITFRDRVTVLSSPTNLPVYVQVLDDAGEDQPTYRIARKTPDGKLVEEVSRDELWVRPDVKSVDVIPKEGGDPVRHKLLAVKPGDAARRGREVRSIVVEDPATKHGIVLDAADVAGVDQMTVSLPLVEIGLIRMVRQADRGFLIAAEMILPLCHLLTSLRWHVLLSALDIRISQARTFTINMVGAFYNAFMPGTTGGDVVKAYYAAKHAPDKRTRAVISVLVDRAIGLYALVIIGGIMATYQWYKWDIPDCRQVAKVAGILTGVTIIGLVVFYVPTLRTITGLNFLLKKLPMQAQVRKAVDAMEAYGRRPANVLLAFVLAFPVHAASILSATFAGKAFGLPLHDLYYWAVVPVIALVGAIPISPQGAGVMEFFAVQLTKRQGVSVSQAFALTMSIRFIQILWNLAAGLFVLRGGYHAPTEKEAHELESDDPAAVAAAAPSPAGFPVEPSATSPSILRPET
jgi:uncharacterized protein (TIRG00374 family)